MDFYRYYVEIGFERYVRKVEITRETYEKYLNRGFTPSSIPIKKGVIEIERENVTFIKVFKEIPK